MKYSVLDGINIQYPWSQKLLNGEKTIETRSYPLPEKYRNVPLAIIETPGPFGKHQGIAKARIIGTIVFSNCFKYESFEAWQNDQERHLVSTNDKNYAFNCTKEKWGWEVESVRPASVFSQPPSTRGIIYAKSCRVYA
jgi:hypothetical protein